MTGLDFEDYNKDQELVVLTKLDTIAFLKIFGLWDFALKNCPNRRVAYLMQHGKNKRVKYKNFKHACRLISKLIKNGNIY